MSEDRNLPLCKRTHIPCMHFVSLVTRKATVSVPFNMEMKSKNHNLERERMH